MARFYFIRHCQADGNLNMVYQGTYDGMVTELGKKELEYLALRFRNEKLDYIFSSSRKRAMETAQAVNKYHGLDIIIDDAVAEFDGGIMEGRPLLMLYKEHPELAKIWVETPHKFVAPEGEAMSHVYERVKNFVYDTAKKYPDANIAVVSHGCAIRCLLCLVKGVPFEQLNEQPWADNTGVCIFDTDDKMNIKLIKENDISHLPDEIRNGGHQDWNTPKGIGFI